MECCDAAGASKDGARRIRNIKLKSPKIARSDATCARYACLGNASSQGWRLPPEPAMLGRVRSLTQPTVLARAALAAVLTSLACLPWLMAAPKRIDPPWFGWLI